MRMLILSLFVVAPLANAGEVVTVAPTVATPCATCVDLGTTTETVHIPMQIHTTRTATIPAVSLQTVQTQRVRRVGILRRWCQAKQARRATRCVGGTCSASLGVVAP